MSDHFLALHSAAGAVGTERKTWTGTWIPTPPAEHNPRFTSYFFHRWEQSGGPFRTRRLLTSYLPCHVLWRERASFHAAVPGTTAVGAMTGCSRTEGTVDHWESVKPNNHRRELLPASAQPTPDTNRQSITLRRCDSVERARRSPPQCRVWLLQCPDRSGLTE
ncbi:hypothetical protein BaRGS_00020021, partial [Batillaria attramentaria]